MALSALLAAPAVAHAQGTIAGRVTAQEGSVPVPEVRVVVIGTNLFGITSQDGRYSIRNVPAGTQNVRVLRVGFVEQRKPVVVQNAQTANLDFVLERAVVQLQEVVTTATGQARRVELGNAVSTVNAAEVVQNAPIANMSDLLTARAPGVVVLPGNLTGTGARIRIRGQNSVSLSNDPIYVIDGIRMNSSSGSSSIGVGGALPSRVNDLNPEEIESIEIVKGPSAATLYGTDAANGVIVITTKRGRAGRPVWRTYVEGGTIVDRNTYPAAYTLAGRSPTGAPRTCILRTTVLGTCQADSLRTFNLFEDEETSPLGTGYRSQYGLQLSGGSEAVRYFTSGEYEQETGLLRIPSFDVRRLNAQNSEIREEFMRPNALGRFSGRANVNATVSPKLELGVSTNFIRLNQRLPQTDNNTTGLLSSAYGGPGFRTNTNSAGDSLFGYRAFTPGDIFQETVRQSINRFIGGVNADWRPTSWLSNRGNVGVDYTNRVDTDLCRRGNCSDFGSQRLGFAVDNRTNFTEFSTDLGSTATFQVTDSWNSKTTLGAQYVSSTFDRNGAAGSNLPPGTVTPAAGAVHSVSAATSLSRTVGFFIEEQVAFRDRLFLTGAVRTDQNSAFGTNFQRVIYPKAAISYLISEESFFPTSDWLSNMRLRASYGASGVQPGLNDALRFFSAGGVNIDKSDEPAVFFSSLGNADLRPERATEFETGFEFRTFRDRATVDITYYNKLTRDALVSRILAPSLGAGATTRRENLGSVRNSGVEAAINAQLVDADAFAWDVTLSGSTNRNELVTLGAGVPPIIGATTRTTPGFPLSSYWQRPITRIEDKDGDGIITYYADSARNEVFVGDSAVFIGQTSPKRQVVLLNGFDLLNRRLRVQTQLDYRAGHYLLNGTERIRCQNRNNCRGLSDSTASLFEQARVVALRDHPARTQAGFMEEADALRLREVAATYTFAPEFARRFLRGESASITFAARNLAVWTKYSGIDPDSDAGAGSGGDLPSDFQTAPPPTYFTLRLNLGF